MQIIIKTMHYVCIYSIQNRTGRSDKNARQELLKEKIKKNNIRHKTVAHMDSFTGNESIVNTAKKNINIQKLLLIQGAHYIWAYFFTIVTSPKAFLFCKYRTDKQVEGENFFSFFYEPGKFCLTLKECISKSDFELLLILHQFVDF